jgi:para-nitrobenzyl esterase
VPKELARTTWRWVQFASPTENFAVPEPERYTISFDAAGWIKLRADCNRGAGGVTFPSTGAIRVGAIALTRAICPRGLLSDQFAQDVARVIRWSLRDGELYLELPGGSGTLRLARQS